MQSKAKTSCRQLANKLRQVLRQACRKPWQGDYQRKTATSQAADKWKTSLRQVPKTAFCQNRVYTIDAPVRSPLPGRWCGDGRHAKEGVLIFPSILWAFRSALQDSSEV